MRNISSFAKIYFMDVAIVDHVRIYSCRYMNYKKNSLKYYL